jgi:hypothetical protein
MHFTKDVFMKHIEPKYMKTMNWKLNQVFISYCFDQIWNLFKILSKNKNPMTTVIYKSHIFQQIKTNYI